MGAGVVWRLGVEMGWMYYRSQLGSGRALTLERSLTGGLGPRTLGKHSTSWSTFPDSTPTCVPMPFGFIHVTFAVFCPLSGDGEGHPLHSASLCLRDPNWAESKCIDASCQQGEPVSHEPGLRCGLSWWPGKV